MVAGRGLLAAGQRLAQILELVGRLGLKLVDGLIFQVPEILAEAGLPPGVVNIITGSFRPFFNRLLESGYLHPDTALARPVKFAEENRLPGSQAQLAIGNDNKIYMITGEPERSSKPPNWRPSSLHWLSR